MNEDMIHAIKAAPPVAVSGLTLLGIPINDLIACVTLIYISLMLIFLVRDKVFKRKRDE